MYGFSKATGDYIAYSDQDDIWLPTKIEVQMAAIGNNMLCLSQSHFFWDDNPDVYLQAKSTIITERPSVEHCIISLSMGCGHNMIFTKELYQIIKTNKIVDKFLPVDLYIGIVADCFGGYKLINDYLVLHRRLLSSVSVIVDSQSIGINSVQRIWKRIISFLKGDVNKRITHNIHVLQRIFEAIPDATNTANCAYLCNLFLKKVPFSRVAFHKQYYKNCDLIICNPSKNEVKRLFQYIYLLYKNTLYITSPTSKYYEKRFFNKL